MNWSQLRTILWLRWRLTRNQLFRGKALSAVLAVVAITVLALIAVGAGVGGFLLGLFAFKKTTPQVLMFIWDGVVFVVLFFSLISVVAEIQRSESLDLTRFLHLPVSLRQVFVLNYLVSLVSLGTVAACFLMTGLGAGLTLSHGWKLVFSIPLALTFLFMLTAWIYCLRGWLQTLMSNPRRKRAIVVYITLGFVLLAQAPNLINLAWHRGHKRPRVEHRNETPSPAPVPSESAKPPPKPSNGAPPFDQTMARIHPWVPILWLPNGLLGLAQGKVWPSLWGGFGMLLIGSLGLARAYRSTVRFYRADDRRKPVKAGRKKPRSPERVGNWVEARVPWLPEDATALGLAQLRSMSRAPEIRMMLVMGMVMAIFLPAMIFWRKGAGIPEVAKPFAMTGVTVFGLFMFLQLICNQFGWDRDGFRGLVLLPTPRERVLLGKNLAVATVAIFLIIPPFAAIWYLVQVPLLAALSSGLQFLSALLLAFTLGNAVSTLVPFRVAPGTFKPGKQTFKASIMIMLAHMMFPLVVAPVFIPPAVAWGISQTGWLSAGPVNLAGALLLFTGCVALYVTLLRPLGGLLQKRETHVLQAVTEAAE